MEELRIYVVFITILLFLVLGILLYRQAYLYEVDETLEFDEEDVVDAREQIFDLGQLMNRVQSCINGGSFALYYLETNFFECRNRFEYIIQYDNISEARLEDIIYPNIYIKVNNIIEPGSLTNKLTYFNDIDNSNLEYEMKVGGGIFKVLDESNDPFTLFLPRLSFSEDLKNRNIMYIKYRQQKKNVINKYVATTGIFYKFRGLKMFGLMYLQNRYFISRSVDGRLTRDFIYDDECGIPTKVNITNREIEVKGIKDWNDNVYDLHIPEYCT